MVSSFCLRLHTHFVLMIYALSSTQLFFFDRATKRNQGGPAFGTQACELDDIVSLPIHSSLSDTTQKFRTLVTGCFGVLRVRFLDAPGTVLVAVACRYFVSFGEQGPLRQSVTV